MQFITRRSLRIRYLAAALLLASASMAGSAMAQTTFGSLSNFDVFNDTGEDCHGFEIELEGVTSADVTYTFGSPYQRYGNPQVVDYPGGVYVRYESAYDDVNHVFTATTPQAPAVITPTNGHACWTGGSGNYLTSGCEHFGLGLRANATRTTYRWLLADPATPGSLRRAGTNSSIPAPSWNVLPNPVIGGAPIVQAVLPPEPREVHAQWGEPMWVKVFVTKSPNPARLERLLSEDSEVPEDETETEMEWKVLQDRPDGAAAEDEVVGDDELVNEVEMGDADKSITRRYEFYEYTGAFDPENHEAMCADGSCDLPLEGELGNYIGAQMVALNLAPIEPLPPVAIGVSKLGAGTGSIVSTPAGIDCGATCSGDFEQDSLVELAATADADSFFGGWSGACSGTDSATSLTASAAATCDATFYSRSASADLKIELKSRATGRAGKRVSFRATVINSGPALATDASMTANFTGITAEELALTRAPRGCAVVGNAIECTLGTIKPGKKARKTIGIRLPAAGAVGIEVNASSTAPSADPSAASASAMTIIE